MVRSAGDLKKVDILTPSKFPHFPASFEKSETSIENFIHALFDICAHWKSKKSENAKIFQTKEKCREPLPRP